MRKYPIQNASKFLYELNNSFIQMDEEGFLEKNEFVKIKASCNIPDCKWTSKMLYSAWEILERNKDFLEDYEYTFDQIPKPDVDESILNKSCTDIMNYENNKLVIENISGCLRSELDIHDDIFQLDFNLDNLYSLIPLILKNKINFSKEALNKINNYLNNLNEDRMKCGLPYSFKQTLKPFQEIGVLFLLINKRVILGDEMGLGKSLQSITAVDLANAYPCLIVCPSSLKYNWQSEIEKASNSNYHFLNGKNPTDKDFYIINYESLHKHLDFIKKLGIKSVIFDESHYLKNEDAKRTKNSLNIISNVEYRFELTGTVILKTPMDLISQLMILNRLENFGSKDKFLENFCNPVKTAFGTDYSGASNLDILSKTLRETCFIRREKQDVLKELPVKTRTKVMVDIPNKDYQKTLKDFLRLDRKDKLKKIEEFRQIVAEYKMSMIKEIIDDFLANNEKIVVFAYHKNIQNKLIELYPDACRIISEDSSLQDMNKKLFQENEDKKIIICSFKAAYMGFDLTAASNVILAEMDWCPAINNQAEDRCHRIGQLSSVNAWYIIAKDTIEEHIWDVCERKREVIEQVYSKDSLDKHIDKNEIYDSIIEEVIGLLEDD